MYSTDNVFDGIRTGTEEQSLVSRFFGLNDFAAHTVSAMAFDLRKFASWFAAQNQELFRFSRVTTRDVIDFRDHLRRERGQAVGTCNRALVSIRRLFRWLPQPLKVMSGNGSLLLFPIDLPYSEESYSMMSDFAEMLANLFNDHDCDIDTAVIKDPSRVLGLVGTMNCSKGEQPNEGRFCKERIVVGNYPLNEPMDGESFIVAVERLMTDHEGNGAAGQASHGILDGSNDSDHAPFAPFAPKTSPTIQTEPTDLTEPYTVWGAIENSTDRVNRCKKYLAKVPESIEEQDGSAKLLRAACECFRFGLSEHDAAVVLDWFNLEKCRPIWTAKELNHKLRDAAKVVSQKGDFGCRLNDPTESNDPTAPNGSGEQNDSCEPIEHDVQPTDFPMTDLGNADYFAKLYGENLRYVVAWKAWLIWNGKNWSRDNTDRIHKTALKFVRTNLPKYATTIRDDERRTKYLKWASMSQSANKIDAIVSLASVILACSPNEFDANPNLFNVSNGTLVLDSQQFRPHDRKDMLIKISAVKYDPTATAPTWEKFIDRIFQNEMGEPRSEVIEYVQKSVGYSMTADTSAQCFFVLHGMGLNGKTTFLNAIMEVMGQYSLIGSHSLMLQSSNDAVCRNSDDVADLFGKRFVAVSETDMQHSFSEAKVKGLVDVGTATAMRKFEHAFAFVKTHKIWMDCNHKPKVKGTDDGIWRRIKLIPFMVQIPLGERDEQLSHKLNSESSGVLNWMLNGLRSFHASGQKLNEPKEISQSVGEYRSDSDSFGQFLSDCIRPSDLERTAVGSAYAAYCSWANENGQTFKLTKIEFSKRMGERGYAVKNSGGRYFVGCSLLNDPYKFQPHESNQSERPSF